jgi:hypothetical protein
MTNSETSAIEEHAYDGNGITAIAGERIRVLRHPCAELARLRARA